MSKLELETFSQSIHIPKVYIAKAEESTPSNYNLRWSGLSYTLGEVVLGSGQAHGDWHSKISGMLINFVNSSTVTWGFYCIGLYHFDETNQNLAICEVHSF